MLYSPAVRLVKNLFAGGGSGLLLLRRVGILLLLACPVLASSQELTLDQAISLALLKNRQIKVKQLEVSKSEHDTEVMRTYRLPQFKVNLMQGQLLNKITFTFPPGSLGAIPGIGPFPPTTTYITTPRRPFTLIQAQANQPLSQLFRIGLGVDAKKLDTQIAKEKLSLQEQAIVNEVKKTFYNLVQAQSALSATEETITLLKEMNRIAANGLEQQVILKSDMLDAEAGLAKAESEATTLEDTLATLKERMNDLLARDLATEFTVSQTTKEVEPWETDLVSARGSGAPATSRDSRGAPEDSGGGDRSASEESRVHSRHQFEHELPFSVRYKFPSGERHGDWRGGELGRLRLGKEESGTGFQNRSCRTGANWSG